MNFKTWLENVSVENLVWHATDVDSADDIMRNKFRSSSTHYEQPSLSNRSGGEIKGVWVSTNKESAVALLRALQRMNGFKSEKEVVQWWQSKGADQAGDIAKRYAENPRPGREHPGHQYLNINQEVGSELVGDEWLWNDLARKLVGKKIVTIEAYYPFAKKTGGIEAGQFVKDVQNIVPERIIYDVSDF